MEGEADGQFPTTHWSLVSQAADPSDPQTRAALTELCNRYWYPLYAFIRRTIGDRTQAEDLTQDFFQHLLTGNLLRTADRSQGRFRTFLLTCCRNHIISAQRRTTAATRSPVGSILSLDWFQAEQRFQQEPITDDDAAQLFLRRWALNILDSAFATLEKEYQRSDHHALYNKLLAYLMTNDEAGYAAIGAELQMTADAVKVSALRFRKRLREIIRDIVGASVSDPAAIDDEIRDLRLAVAS